VFFAGLSTAAFFVLGISAYHLLKESPDREVYRRSFNIALVLGLVSTAMVGMVGHTQGQHMFEAQPMKMAAAEALWETADPAPLSLFTIGNERELRDVFAIKLPGVLSFLAYNRFSGEVKGIRDLQAEYTETYGPGDYVPPVWLSYWSFRGMMTPGLLMGVLGLYGTYLLIRGRTGKERWFLWILPWAIPLPYIANTAGWLLTEVGRQPWIVFGLMRTEDAVSPSTSTGAVLATLLIFTLLYGALMAADVYLLQKFARKGSSEEENMVAPAPAEAGGGASWI
jgi:cytochrome d ubiquinol oxidase subunit I